MLSGHTILNEHDSLLKEELERCIFLTNCFVFLLTIVIITCKSLQLKAFCGHLFPISTASAST